MERTGSVLGAKVTFPVFVDIEHVEMDLVPNDKVEILGFYIV